MPRITQQQKCPVYQTIPTTLQFRSQAITFHNDWDKMFELIAAFFAIPAALISIYQLAMCFRNPRQSALDLELGPHQPHADPSGHSSSTPDNGSSTDDSVSSTLSNSTADWDTATITHEDAAVAQEPSVLANIPIVDDAGHHLGTTTPSTEVALQLPTRVARSSSLTGVLPVASIHANHSW